MRKKLMITILAVSITLSGCGNGHKEENTMTDISSTITSTTTPTQTEKRSEEPKAKEELNHTHESNVIEQPIVTEGPGVTNVTNEGEEFIRPHTILYYGEEIVDDSGVDGLDFEQAYESLSKWETVFHSIGATSFHKVAFYYEGTFLIAGEENYIFRIGIDTDERIIFMNELVVSKVNGVIFQYDVINCNYTPIGLIDLETMEINEIGLYGQEPICFEYTEPSEDNLPYNDGIIMEDMDFDGIKDLRIATNQEMHNTYYACWLWDEFMEMYVYFNELSQLVNPEFDHENLVIHSNYYISDSEFETVNYQFIDGVFTRIN